MLVYLRDRRERGWGRERGGGGGGGNSVYKTFKISLCLSKCRPMFHFRRHSVQIQFKNLTPIQHSEL